MAMKIFGQGEILKIAKSYKINVTPRELIQVALSCDDIDVILVGFQSMEELDFAYKIFERGIKLSKEELLKLYEKGDEFRKIYCFRCEYCLPCPQGIDIPKFMRLFNYPGWEWPKRLRVLKSLTPGPSDCTLCGECEPLCPQKLQIRERMQHLKKLCEMQN